MLPTSRPTNEYYVFLASPGDVNPERQAVRDFFDDYNTTTASPRGLRFTVIDWENCSTSGFGRPQELITNQTFERHRDHLVLVIGIMGQRFGSPSGTHESGTEEEFEWALHHRLHAGWPELKWFFRKVEKFEAPSEPEKILDALDQWKKVRAFRERLDKEKTLYFREFLDTFNFRDVLRRDLSLWLNAPERPWTKEIEETRSTLQPSDQSPQLPSFSVLTVAERETLLRRYLEHVIGRNSYLQLQGIRSGGRLVNIDLDQIYITLKATRTRTVAEEEAWLAEERQLAPGEAHKLQHALRTETVVVKVEEALAEHKHLVVLGDPGSGKTTLLRYLALCYARDRAKDGSAIVRERLGLPESGSLPVLLPLRNLGSYLQTYHPKEDGTEGHERLLEFLRAYLKGERIPVPDDFFDADLHSGRVVLLFDGMDEVGDFDLRRRVARLIESLATAYSACRMVVTSRLVGYTGATRLGDGFATTTVRDFTLADVREFLAHWHRLIAIGQMGKNESAEHFAADQTAQLMKAIEDNPRVRELAINPLMLTVIALVHRDRVELPERRAELYAEAIDVLLGKWDAARGVQETRILDDRPFDTGDRRLLLQALALAMHEAGQKEIATGELEKRLRGVFVGIVQDDRAADNAAARFLSVAQERTGLLVEAGQGVYRFSHLTFQEYLAAVEVAERDDSIAYTLRHTADAFWREAILLEAGYLSTKNRAKTTRLIQAVADSPIEPEPFHNLVLAAECVRDVGPTRVEGDLALLVRQRLQAELERPLPQGEATWLTRLWGKVAGTVERRRVLVSRRMAAATALSRIEGGSFGAGSQYWSLPHGEPEWVTIPAGEFWMGSEEYPDEKPVHRMFVPEFRLARTPVTNAQYWLYVQAKAVAPPEYWDDGLPPKDKLAHPVVGVSWHEAQRYCAWLSQMTEKQVRLPTEAEWEKAARGDRDRRRYPWGERFDATLCNGAEAKIEDTSPVGLFPAGASPYGCFDMSGNVWEWVADWFAEDYYQQGPGRDLQGPQQGEYRVVRGGSWNNEAPNLRVSNRNRNDPGNRNDNIGFRCAE